MPKYSQTGNHPDALTDSGGDVLVATNELARAAAKLFEQTEGNDIHPASAVAAATLIEAAEDGNIDKNAVIMLNITGGGEERFKAEKELFYLNPDLIFDFNPDVELVQKEVSALFK